MRLARKEQGVLPEKAIQRLSVYRRLLCTMTDDPAVQVYSHELAAMGGVTAAQVRRDLMNIGYSGSPTRGYNVRGLIEHLGHYLDASEPQQVALIGVGNFGQALMSYFAGRRPNVQIVAGFDTDVSKVGRVIHGCRCHHLEQLTEVVRGEKIDVAILAVPAADAQRVAVMAAVAGVRAILNFAPVRLRMPANVFVEDVDLTVCLEKVAFFARHNRLQREAVS